MEKTLKNKIKKFMVKMEGYANRMLKDSGVSVKITTRAHESFTYFKNKKNAVIQIGIEDVVNPRKRMDAEENSWANIAMRLEGVVNHEVAHLLYSQFERVKYCGNKEREFVGAIKTYALGNKESILDATDAYNPARNYTLDYFEDKAPDKDMFATLRKMFYDRVYWHNMKSMLNMVEDGAIEAIIPSKHGASQGLKDRIYGSIAAARNHLYDMEKENVEHTCDELDGCMWEFHEFGVIGYRMPTPRTHLKHYFTKKEIDDLFDLAMYGKWNTKNTEERYIVARTALNQFSSLIQEKSDKHMEAYLEALAFANDASYDLPDLPGMSSEVSISMPNGTASASSSQKSEYDYDASDETKKKIKEQKEQVEEEQNQSGNDGDGNGEDNNSGEGNESNEDSQKGTEEGQKSDGQQNAGDNSNESEEGNDSNKSEKKQSDSSSGDGEQSSGKDGEQSSDSKEGDNSKPSKDMEASHGSSDAKSKTKGSAEDKDAEEIDSSNKDYGTPGTPISKSDLKEFEKRAGETMKKLKNSIEKMERDNIDNRLKDSVKEQASQIKRQLNSKLPDCDIDFHSGIKTKLYTDFSEEHFNENALKKQSEDNKMVVKVASEMNLIKMYDRRAKSVIAKRGKLNNSTLYRAMTDQKCFKKTTPGKKKNFRVALLMDLSGSMSGRKMVNTIRTAYVLANSCIRCKVPVAVWGHDYNGECNLYKFVDYNQKTPKDLKNIYTAYAGGCNQDGLAIYHTLHDLVAHKHGDEELILIVISDGMPAGANSYYGIPAEEDIKSITGTFKKVFGVHTIGVTIETSQDEIDSCRRIYGENTVVVENSDDLSLETVKVLKNIIC